MDPDAGGRTPRLIASVAAQRDLPAYATTVAIAVAHAGVAAAQPRPRRPRLARAVPAAAVAGLGDRGAGAGSRSTPPAQFFDHLIKVKGWQDLAVTVAGQKVQHSGRPTAYAQWEPRATAMAQGTDRRGAGRDGLPLRQVRHRGAGDRTVHDDGEPTRPRRSAGPVLGVDLPADRGWLAVDWLMSRAADLPDRQAHLRRARPGMPVRAPGHAAKTNDPADRGRRSCRAKS